MLRYLRKTLQHMFLLSWTLAFGLPSAAPQHVQKKAGFGFASLTTVQAAAQVGESQAIAGDVVVCLHGNAAREGVCVLTNDLGIVLIPLRAGAYCADAYGTDGSPVKLDDRAWTTTHNCFESIVGGTVEFSLTLANGVKYSREIPSFGVR
jgi:hypothetical protein